MIINIIFMADIMACSNSHYKAVKMIINVIKMVVTRCSNSAEMPLKNFENITVVRYIKFEFMLVEGCFKV